MDPKAPPNFTSPTKPPKISTMTQDEIDKIYRQMEKRITENRKQMEHKMDEMENKMDKKMNENENEMKENMDEMENKLYKKMNDMTNMMDENIQKSMKELQNSFSSMVFHSLYDRPSKGDIKMKGTWEKLVFQLNTLLIIRNFLLDLTLIVELIVVRV
jgi:DNA repair exonuclease SbcCD ATPase subunit